MIQYSKVSGEIHIIEQNNSSAYVILDNYEGTLEISNDILFLRLLLIHDSKITNELKLSQDSTKLDKIAIIGDGTLDVEGITATTIDIEYCNSITSSFLHGVVIKLVKCKINSKDSGDTFIEATSHIYLYGMILTCS